MWSRIGCTVTVVHIPATRTPGIPTLRNSSSQLRSTAHGSDDLKVVSFVDSVKSSFFKHPLHFVKREGSTLVDYLSFLSNQTECRNHPIIVSMARVQSPLYWQLIEGFFHSMFYFDHLSCSVMICITDPNCVRLCRENGYPCFDYRHPDPNVHVMEQVGEVKINEVWKALEAGVHIMLLDLDIGFLKDPAVLYEGFFENPFEQIRAQMDVNSCMNKSAGNTWFTQPLTNFGLFIVKSHEYSIKAFRQASKQYKRIPLLKKTSVATDQNVVGGAIKWARWRFGYNFSYFDVGFPLGTKPRPVLEPQVLLLHHINLMLTTHGKLFQLGGEVAANEIRDAVGVHATCYERATKLLGLKAANAYWNFMNYDPNRRTLTKPLMILSKTQITQEVTLLAQLAQRTNRALLVPNVLVGVGRGIPGHLKGGLLGCREQPYMRSAYCHEAGDYRNEWVDVNTTYALKHNGEYYWPGFRIVDESSIKSDLKIVDPGYYHRVARHNDALRMKGFRNEDAMLTNRMGEVASSSGDGGNTPFMDTPEPYVFTIDMAKFKKDNNHAFAELVATINALPYTRVVLDVIDSSLSSIRKTSSGGSLLQNSAPSVFRLTRHHHIVEHEEGQDFDGNGGEVHEEMEEFRGGPTDLVAWAKDSVNSWSSPDGPTVSKYTYVPFTVNNVRVDTSLEEFRLCGSILVRQYGNRSCFDICK